MEWYCWILLILGIAAVIFLTGCKKKEEEKEEENGEEEEEEEEKEEEEEVKPEPPIPDPLAHMWQPTDDTTQRWRDYLEYMKRITSEIKLAAEMRKKVLIDGVWKYFYHWVSDWDLHKKHDYWDLADEVWKRGTADCDGFARLICDVLGRILKFFKVYWVEHYGFYRKYTYDPETGEYSYKIVAGGHAIAVYEKDGELLAFSNTSWWEDQNFEDYLDICEKTFPEGIYLIRCRHWEEGWIHWVMKAKEGEILEGTNIFHRKLRLIRNLKPLKRGERKKTIQTLNKGGR